MERNLQFHRDPPLNRRISLMLERECREGLAEYGATKRISKCIEVIWKNFDFKRA
jgi:hypothetical protein